MHSKNKTKKAIFLFGLFSFLILNTLEAQNLPVIPAPTDFSFLKGSCNINQFKVINFSGKKQESNAKFLQNELVRRLKRKIKIKNSDAISSKSVFLSYNNDGNNAESYKLSISDKSILISGSEAGVFRGIQSLLQIYDASGNGEVPCLKIEDHPLYTWRGMHLDVCRHFFPLTFIKKYIDMLAYYKMNVFHWHLTDDQGWRIEIKKYPLLQEKAAWRKGSMVGAYKDNKVDSIPYGGFYTQSEIKEIVAYASERYITVVPEIEMPGHAMAALCAYPSLSCSGGPFETAKTWGVFDDVFCPKPETFTFLKDVLTEVMDLFPSTYIHIGGDECPKTRWKKCNHCQSLMAQNQLKDEHELQSFFIRSIEKFVNEKGRRIIGWDEILEGGLAPNAAVMSWRGVEGGIAAARLHHPVVMSPGSHCYFDHYQADPAGEPHSIGGFTPLKKVYSFNPMPDSLYEDEKKYLIGAQANLWTEYISDTSHAEYMMMPRMIALSEVLWGTSNTQKYDDFLNRLRQQINWLNMMKINYAKHDIN